MASKTSKSHNKQAQNLPRPVAKTNQIQTYTKTELKHNEIKLQLPDFDVLVEITRLSDQIALQTQKLEQKKLVLIKTKEDYRQKLLGEEQSIRDRIVTVKKRQNIAQIVEKIRQSELELQDKLHQRIDSYQPTKSLNKNQKNNLFSILINQITNA
jgi:hypothetical protein